MKRGLVLASVLLLAASAAPAKVFVTQDEALKLAFPGAVLERKTAYLTDAERSEIAKSAGGERPAGVLTYYVARKDGRLAGTAYVDVHLVRTQNEVLMVVVDPAGAISRLEVLAFNEPEEYLPRSNWYAQFPGKTLGDELAVKRGVRPVTGATLTVRATTEAARRVLAIHRLLASRDAGAKR